MTDEERVAVEHRPAGEIFGLLSDDLRVEIVQALGEANEPLAFSTLREVVGEPDSGKFNYHLRKLVGVFVTKADDGYRLSLAGDQMYGAIVSGAYTADASIEPFEFEGPCPTCGSDVLLAEYTDERAKTSCPDCEEFHNEFPFPPGSLDQFPRADLPAAFDRWMRASVTTFLQGFCTNCGGRVDTRLERTDEDTSQSLRLRFECRLCGYELRSSLFLPLLYHPVAVSFFERRGVDVFNDPTWRFWDHDDEVTVEMVEEDPLQARISIVLDGGEIVATLDFQGAIQTIRTDG